MSTSKEAVVHLQKEGKIVTRKARSNIKEGATNPDPSNEESAIEQNEKGKNHQEKDQNKVEERTAMR